jgi:hypothetical protein
MPYEVFVFERDGGVVEANIIDAPNPSVPKTVSSVSPLRVAYEQDGKTVVCSGKFSVATWRHDVQRRKDLEERLEQIFESWQRSGSTNFEVWKQEMDSTITDSQK